MNVKDRKVIVIRCAIIFLYILFAYFVFVTGRTHTVLLDNKNVEENSVKAINGMTVSVNNLPPLEFLKGDRDKVTVKGQKLKITVKSFDGSISYSGKISIPFTQDSVLLSLPLFVNQKENALIPFEL